jgi:hypothetical protein
VTPEGRVAHSGKQRTRRAGATAVAAGATAAAIAIGGGCGSSGAGSGQGGSLPSVALDMKAGGNAYNVERCGVSHHYTTYRVGQRIEWGGQLTPAPSGHWDVKFKVKRCERGAFQTVQQTHAPGQPHGYASGVVRGLSAGYYFGRLYYYRGKSSSESDKEHFLLRTARRG